MDMKKSSRHTSDYYEDQEERAINRWFQRRKERPAASLVGNKNGTEPVMDDGEWEQVRQNLLSYPNATPEIVEAQIASLSRRLEEKEFLLQHGYSNAQAESLLDKKGYVRMPGWKTVFFYPGSSRLRTKYIFFTALILLFVVYVSL
jgi:hypothetical protein